MKRWNLLKGFKLNDDQSIHNEICTKAFIKVLSFEFNRFIYAYISNLTNAIGTMAPKQAAAQQWGVASGKLFSHSIS